MMDVSNIEIKNNYVLIKPDKDYETLKCGLFIGSTAETEARHYGITGEVLVTPEKLIFRGKEINELRSVTGGQYGDDQLKTLHELVNGSLEFKTECELKPGDKVWFDYLAHINAISEKKAITIEGHGECILVEYTRVFIRERKGERAPINGWIWIKTIQGERDLGNGIEVPETVDVTVKNEAIVVTVGKPIEQYLSALESDRGLEGLQPGMRIFFNQGVMTPLEYTLHESDGLEKLYKIKRKDIYAVLP